MEFREPPSRNLQCSNECLPVKDKLHHKGVPRINCDDFLDKWREQSWSVLKSLMSWRFETASQVNKFWLSCAPSRHEWLPSIPKHFLFHRDSHPAGWLEDLSSSLLWWDPWDTSPNGKKHALTSVALSGNKTGLAFMGFEWTIYLGNVTMPHGFFRPSKWGSVAVYSYIDLWKPFLFNKPCSGRGVWCCSTEKASRTKPAEPCKRQKKTSLPIGGCPIRHHQKKSKLSKSSTSTINVDISCKPSESRWGPSIAKNNEANGCHKFQAVLPGRYHWMMYVWT